MKIECPVCARIMEFLKTNTGTTPEVATGIDLSRCTTWTHLNNLRKDGYVAYDLNKDGRRVWRRNNGWKRRI